MKLKDWAEKQGISYITAYRWFKDSTLPVKAYQTESGTIIVQDEDENVEKPMANNNQQSSDIMSLFLKKTVEFSKNNSSVEDFAAYILSNFSLKLSSALDSPKYSKVKPKSEDIQKHFQKFLKPKGEKPKPNMFVAEGESLDKLVADSDSLVITELTNEINNLGGDISSYSFTEVEDVPEMKDLIKDLSASLSPLPSLNSVTTYNSLGNSESVVVRNVEKNPQSTNYTSSTSSAFGNLNSSNSILSSIDPGIVAPQSAYIMTNGFQPTIKEVEKAHEAFGKMAEGIRAIAATATKRRRGRKPSKKTGIK